MTLNNSYKYSKTPIPRIIYLDNNRYEFCYNHIEEYNDNHKNYKCEYILMSMPVNEAEIVMHLMLKGYTEEKASEIIQQ